MLNRHYDDVVAKYCKILGTTRLPNLVLTRIEDVCQRVQELDKIKANMVYERALPPGMDMLVEEGIDNPSTFVDGDVLHMMLGLITESGELLEEFAASIREGRNLDYINMKEEAGDILFFAAGLLRFLGIDPLDALKANADKLCARFGDGYNQEAANHRDKDNERLALS